MAYPACKQTYVLQDIFTSYPSVSPCSLCLTDRTLFVRRVCNGKVEHSDIEVCNIIGCQSDVKKSRNDEEDVSCYLRIYHYPLKLVGGILSKQPRREKHVAKFVMRKFETYAENSAVVNKWKCVIMWMLRGKRFGSCGSFKIPEVLPPPLKLLIIVNPHSGPGRASSIFKDQVVPMLVESDAQYDVLVTDRINCARDYVKQADLSMWNGIVAVSGDGLLFEIFNGLMEREDWEVAIKFPVGVVPGGSGNGLARAINYAAGEPYDTTLVTSSVLNIVSGRSSPMDLVHVQTPVNVMYSFLSIGWGLMADIDIESEKLRAIGEARFTIWAVIRALGLRKYKGRLSYLPVVGYEPKPRSGDVETEPKVKRSKTLNSHFAQSDDFETRNGYKSEEPVFRSKSFADGKSEIPGHSSQHVHLLHFSSSGSFDCSDSSCSEDISTVTCTDKAESSLGSSEDGIKNSVHKESSNTNRCCSHKQVVPCETDVPLFDEPVPDTWTVVEGEFVLVYAAHQTHLSSDVLFAPDAKLDDGIIWLVVMKSDVSRAQVIYFLASLQTGDHVHIPYVDVIPVHAFRLEPYQTDSVLTVDGEVIPCTTIQASVLPSVARVMTR